MSEPSLKELPSANGHVSNFPELSRELIPAYSEPVPASPSETRYLLVKAHVGFGDRLQCLSQAIEHAKKYNRTLSVDWSDSIWSDGTVDFDTFFHICGVQTVPPAEIYQRNFSTVEPIGWMNQYDRKASCDFIFKTEYELTLKDEDLPSQLVVYPSVGLRTYYVANLCMLRVKKPWRDSIVQELKRYSKFKTLVHLRGTDKHASEKIPEYMEKIKAKMADIPKTEPVLIVSDSLPLYQELRESFPNAVLRTPNLDRFRTDQGTHFQLQIPKSEFNLNTLIDFFLIAYSSNCIAEGESMFYTMARFLDCGPKKDILGYDGD
ncbi:hypothetical protein KIH39_15515 [Telmatocola sphagniphila]|uniref:Uncharacterized protein n=1 Tax=Telmatocola sphagniphila TaxID=1123043 RepID=A0A8E6B368_9BACT|nr:hypothetical protein [Telmatocola sphagniphila]QVL30261.1 hypothetical protein KIH39_15515 [Telmatocola sphagniphila]